MPHRAFGKQLFSLRQRLNRREVPGGHFAVLIVNGKPGEERYMIAEQPIIRDIVCNLHAVGHTKVKVILTMAGSNVHKARTGIGAHKIAG